MARHGNAEHMNHGLCQRRSGLNESAGNGEVLRATDTNDQAGRESSRCLQLPGTSLSGRIPPLDNNRSAPIPG